MKGYLFLLTVLIISLTSLLQPASADSYTLEEVQQHNAPEDCWMIFEQKVYSFDIDYLENHKTKFMDIDSWCGEDMTVDFRIKPGSGEDHKPFSYTKLEDYYIGELIQDTSPNSGTGESPQVTNPPERKNTNPYNFWLPALLGYGTYTLYWSLTKIKSLNKYKLFNKNTFSFIFNTLMLLGLIPTVGFGYFMIARYSFEELRDIDFNFLYWHVELSIVFAGLVTGHFLTRFKLYKAPLSLFFRKNVNDQNQS